MGKGYTTHNVWPTSSPNLKVKGDELLASQLKDNETIHVREKGSHVLEPTTTADTPSLADQLAKALTPILESISKNAREESQHEKDIQVSQKKLEEIDVFKKREKYFIIALVVFGLLALASFLSAAWSASSVEKLLRIIYKLKQQTKP